MKRLIVIVFAVLIPIVIVGGGLLWVESPSAFTQFFNRTPATTVVTPTGAKSNTTTSTNVAVAAPISPAAYKNATYSIDGHSFTLVNGHAESPVVAGSASRLVTDFFGDEVVGNLNADTLEDAAFLITQSSGGSGTFYYVVVAIQTAHGVVGTNAILLGDRIAPQVVTISNRKIMVSYAERKLTDPMTVQPSIMVSKNFELINGILTEVQSK